MNVRPYRCGDEGRIVELFGRVFGRPINEAHWRWKLATLPSPTENVWLATREDAVDCHYGGIPCRFRLPTGESTAIVSVDAMTHPDRRRRGLLTAVARRAHDRWHAAGIPFTLGLPNRQWGSRIDALGWKRLFAIEWLVRPLRPSTIVGRWAPASPLGAPIDSGWNALWNRKIDVDPTIEVRHLGRTPDRPVLAMLDDSWRARRDQHDLSIVRDAAWVSWRYLACPSIAYRVLLAARGDRGVGYVAYRTRTSRNRQLAFIADLATADDDEAAKLTLLSSVIEEMRDAAADAVLVMAVPDTPLHRTLRRAGFVFRKGKFHLHIASFDAARGWETADDPRRWCLAGGDFDVV